MGIEIFIIQLKKDIDNNKWEELLEVSRLLRPTICTHLTLHV